jgi:uncharacterized protein YbjT (DUF2867 family)
MNRALVIGATGNVGRQVLFQLPVTGAQVRALTRNPHATPLPPRATALVRTHQRKRAKVILESSVSDYAVIHQLDLVLVDTGRLRGEQSGSTAQGVASFRVGDHPGVIAWQSSNRIPSVPVLQVVRYTAK